MACIETQMGQPEAAHILAGLLGGSTEEWVSTLEDDRRNQPGNRLAPFCEDEDGNAYYLAKDIAQLVMDCLGCDQEPGLGLWVGSVEGSSFGIGARVVCDWPYMFVDVQLPQHFYGKPWITADDARTLASQLTFMADICDAYAIGRTTAGDVDIEELLAELASSPSCEETRQPNVNAKEAKNVEYQK